MNHFPVVTIMALTVMTIVTKVTHVTHVTMRLIFEFKIIIDHWEIIIVLVDIFKDSIIGI